ncbi:hypothetical protein JAAARDRAFT_193565 [Jaapia argillacea MUCL 33604]|uniref:Uncharacterized protein n=1 Tax=Jaapia argillacea MUCL 33604 TaxID=933084 RepID=A0A067PTP9_9AGAM|nr:hypothetical protein JAAARDRAFT_193565 [Jaapia argillacea MUCL 33604]
MSNPSPRDIQRTRFTLLRLLPIELVDSILHQAEYYTILHSTRPVETTISDSTFCCLRSRRTEKPVKRVVIKVEGHDQGWSSYPADQGTYRGSWTWFEAGIGNKEGGEGERRWGVARNLHAESAWQVHEVVWGEDHELLKSLREGDSIDLYAAARYPGWRNTFRNVEIEVFCWI